MKKFAFLFALVAVASAANAATIYDSLYTTSTQTSLKTLTFAGGAGNETMGGVFGLDTGAGAYNLTSLQFVFANFTASTLVDQTINIQIFDDLDGSTANGPLFAGNQILNADVTFAGLNLGSNQGTIATVTGFGNVTLDDSHLYGIQLSSGTTDVTFGVSSGAANYVGDDLGFSGFFLDADQSGTLEGGEGFTFGNSNEALALNIGGQAVPEPASLAVLGLGAAAMLRRRKKA